MRKLLVVWLLNALALMLVATFLPGIEVRSYGSALWAAVVLGLVNTLVKPVLTLLTLPITILTMGVFYLVLNGLMFWWVGSMLSGFVVNGLLAAMLGAILYSVTSGFLSWLILKE